VTQPAAAIWDALATRLETEGIVGELEAGKRERSEVRVASAVKSWLDAEQSRRLLLLIDEADGFFDADAESGFTNTRLLKELRESTDARCKPVFAGLHQVQRFVNVPNQPFAHLGRPTPIGPLSPQAAFELLTLPLAALGFQFESDDTVSRALGKLNYIPMLIQLFGEALLRQLMAGPSPTCYPQVITEDEVEAILESDTMRDEVRSRFELTLALDPRYKAIAYLVAGNTKGGGEAVSASNLKALCHEWWPDGFSGISPAEFRALCEEMVDLGVLANSHDGRYLLRSTNVSRLLGDDEHLSNELLALQYETPPPRSMAKQRRRVLEDGVRSPVPEEQMGPLVGQDENQCVLIVGSRALDSGSLGRAIKSTGRYIGRFQPLLPVSARAFAAACRGLTGPLHHVVYFELGQAEDGATANVGEVVRSAIANRPAEGDIYTRSAVLSLGPRQIREAKIALGDGSSTTRLADLVESLSGIHLLALEKYTEETLRVWAIDEPAGFTDEGNRARLAEVTGGWPVLVNEVSSLAHRLDPRMAIEEVGKRLETRKGSMEFLVAAGFMDANAEGLRLNPVWQSLAELGADQTFTYSDAIDWVTDHSPGIDFLPDCVDGLILGGALTLHPDSMLSVDPVMIRANQAWTE
jgi:hypothetical protein